MHGAGGIGDGAGGNGACLHRLFNGHLQIVDIIQRVKNPDNVNAVFHGFAHKFPYKVVGIVGVAQHILAAQQHLQLGFGHLGPDFPQPLPGILMQVAQAHIKGCAAPALAGIEPGPIHGFQNRLKLAVGHPGCDQRLVCVPQHRLDKLNILLFRHLWHLQHRTPQSGT